MALCEYCGERPAIKTDGQCKLVCRSCLLPGTFRNIRVDCGRNELCLCGSGKKFKKCCLSKVKGAS